MAKKQIKKYVFEPGISKDANLYPRAVALLQANKAFLQAQVVAFINDRIANNIPPYDTYTYAPEKCSRDVGFFIDAILHDLRYGGNVKCRAVADYFWIDGEPQIRGDVSPEITGQAYLRDIINNFIFTNTTVTPNYNQLSVPQVKITGENAESSAATRNSTLWNVFSTVIQNGIPAMPVKVTGVSSIKLLGKYLPSEILLITNTSTGDILYNFADPSNSISISYKDGRSSGNGELLSDLDFPTWWQTTDNISTLLLSVDTSALSSTTDIQIFVEEESQTIRPWEFGTDAIERMRVAAPQAMLDADFEYGIQPTKWQALGLIRNYPSVFEVPGSDLSVSNITTDASSNSGGFGSSLITVTTTGSHGFSVGTPITVRGLDSSASGFSRAEGSFLVYSVPSSVSFTYYSSSKVGTTAGQSLFTTFVQIRQAGFYTGSSIGSPTFSVFSNGSNQIITSKFDTPSGSFQIAFDGTSPTSGSPISGSPNIVPGTSISGVVGSSTIVANVKETTTVTDTSVKIVDLTGIQASMAIDDGTGTAVFINSVGADSISLSDQVGVVYNGANGESTAVTGTNVSPIGSGAVFDVFRSAGTYTVTDAGDSSSNGTNYVQGDRLLIAGTDLGGASPANDVIIAVTDVDSGGSITAFSVSGTSITGGATYSNVSSTSTTSPLGSGALITVVRTGGTGAYQITLSSPGNDYSQTDQITWSGTLFGGISPENDIVIRVDGVEVDTGRIIDFTILNNPVGATGNANYTSISGTNIPVSGASAEFTVTREDGNYSAVPTNGGTGYLVGNRILVSGTALDGSSPANDCVLTVTSASGGEIQEVSATGTPFAGDQITVYPTLTLSDPITDVITDGTVLNVGAIATVQVDFSTPHGLLPGTTILTNISSAPSPEFESTSRVMSASASWVGVAFLNGTFVATATGTNATARSIDGENWVAGGTLATSGNWTCVAAGTIGGTDYFVTLRSGSTEAAYSVDAGISWTAMTGLPSGTWTSVTFADGAFVAVASGGTVAAYSINGTSWTSATLPSSGTWTDVTAGFVGTSVYFIAVASGGTAAAYSVDKGASWVATGALPASTTWSTVVYGNSRFLAVATGGTNAAISTNGTTWSAVVLPSSAAWNCSAFGDDNFVVVASGGTSVITSFTGETGSWTSRTMSASATWEEIAYGNYQGTGIFAVVGNLTNANSIKLTSANHQLAGGPFVITRVPSATSLRYPARTTGTISISAGALTGSLFVRPDSFFVHRPFDGGVQLGTGGASYGSQAIRQSKKYIRYQSGKGIMYTTGGLFAPSYNLSAASAENTVVGSLITFTCDDTDHGLQPGAIVEIIGMVSFEYNGEYEVEGILDSRRFRVRSNVVLSSLTGSLGAEAKVIMKRWHGATVRIGAFDDQNGIFYQYDGQEMAVVRRSSTTQLSGTVAISTESNQLTGAGTRFQDQLKVGDKIVLRGMSHTVTSITSQTSMSICPDWRGASSITGAKLCLTTELYIPQSEWNMDTLDGTGPSGYNLLPWRMQMLGIQYSWYAAGFIEFMMRGSDGKFVFLHRIRNSNVNTEAYMRTANLPVRYEVENSSARSKLAEALSSGAGTLKLTDAKRFPTSGTIYVGNEMISYAGKSGNTLTGLTRAATLLAFAAGQNRTFQASQIPQNHAAGAGVELMSVTCSPTISHWGSALLTDGLFDEDRGYIFNYAATGLSFTTAKQTAFMIRLAPSVSNALTGDLGERDLLNRAQLLLKDIAITADTGTGAIVVEGVLNPRNYPSDPTRITWNNLTGSGAGGQPSFAQIALGGSINWGGVAPTTSTATIQGSLTTTSTARAFNTVTQNITARALTTLRSQSFSTASNDFFITNADYDSITATPLRVGDRLTTSGGGSPLPSSGNYTISAITRDYLSSGLTRIVLNANANQNSFNNETVTVTSIISTTYANALSVARTDFLMTDTDVTNSGILVGDTLSLTTFLVSAQTVQSITPTFARVGGVNYSRIIMNTIANSTSGSGSNQTVTITAAGTAASYSSTNFLFFTNASWNSSGASVGTRVATSVTQFPAGTAVAGVTTRRLGTTTVRRVTFTQSSNATLSAAATITFQFGDPQFALPGEQVFSFVANPGSTVTLDLNELKELTTTAIGGRGAFPNGPDVLAINVLKTTGAAAPGSVILRWGEAQA
jgi:hypothetical protein